MPVVALAMIADAKSAAEREELRAALASAAAGCVCGVVVLDDRSLPEADDDVREFGFTPVRRRWNDNFSAARNFALQHVPAEADWVFVLDRDEVVHGGADLPRVCASAEAAGCDMARVWVTIHPHGGGAPANRPQRRLHRNLPDFVWRRDAHNQLYGGTSVAHPIEDGPRLETSYEGTLHEHNYGRTIPILERMLQSEDEEDREHATYWLARTYAVLHEPRKCLEYAVACINAKPDFRDYALVYKYAASALCEMGRQGEGWSVLFQGIAKHPTNSDLIQFAASFWAMHYHNVALGEMSAARQETFHAEFVKGAELMQLEFAA